MGPLRRVKLVEVHSQLVCELCSGYFVDATTIIECLHTFCKSCIVRYLETSNYCPTCEALVHKTKPLLNIREDKTVQDIVYKLVPGLFHKEINRRHSFYVEHPEACGDKTEQKLKEPRHFFYVDDQISLSLEYLPPAYAKPRKNGSPYAHLPSITNTSAKNINSVAEGEGRATPHSDSKCERTESADEDVLEDKMSMKTVHKRYLKCPAAVQVSHLEKFVRLKYGLSPKHRIDIVHGGDHLDGDLTLLDVVYMYKWAEDAPLRLFYTVTVPRVTRKRHRMNGTRAPNSEKGSSPPRKMPRGEEKTGGTEGGVAKCPVNMEGVEESQTQPQGAVDSVHTNSKVDVKVGGESEGGPGGGGGREMVIEEDKMEVDEKSCLKGSQGSCSNTDTLSQLPPGTTSANESSSAVGIGTAPEPSAPQHANGSLTEVESQQTQHIPQQQTQKQQQKVQKQSQKQQQPQRKQAQQAQQTEQKVHQQEHRHQLLQQNGEKQRPLKQDVKRPHVVKQQQPQQQQPQQQQQVMNQQKQQQIGKQEQDLGKQEREQEVKESQQAVKQQQQEVVKQQQAVKQHQPVNMQQQQVVKPQGKQLKQQQAVKPQQQVAKPQQPVMRQQQQQQQKQTLAQPEQRVTNQEQNAGVQGGPKKDIPDGSNNAGDSKSTGRPPSTGKSISGSKSLPQPQPKSAPAPPAPPPQQQVSKQLPNGTVGSSGSGMVVVGKLEEGKVAAAASTPVVSGKPISDKVPPPIIPTKPRLGRPPNASRKLNAAMSVTAPGTAVSPRFVAPTPSQVSKCAAQPASMHPPAIKAVSSTSPQAGPKVPNSSINFSPAKGGAPLRGGGANRNVVCPSLNVQNRLSSISGSPAQLQNSKLVVKKIANATGSKESPNRLGKPGASPPSPAPVASTTTTGKSSASNSSMEVVSSASPASRLLPVSSGGGMVVPRPPVTHNSRPPSAPSTCSSSTSSCTPSPPLSTSCPSSSTTYSTVTTTTITTTSTLTPSHRAAAQHGTEQRLTSAAAPASKTNPAAPQVQQQVPRFSAPAGSTKMPPKSPGKARNPANILSIAQSLANKQLQQRTVTSCSPMTMPLTVTPATPPTPSPASKEGGSKNNTVSHGPAATSNNMTASIAVGTATATSSINAPVSSVPVACNVTATNVPVSNVTATNVPVSVPTCLASQFVSMANPNLAGMNPSPLSPTLAAYVASAFGDASLFHSPLHDAAMRNLITWGQAAARFRDMNLATMGTGTPANLLDQHNFNLQPRTDAAPMDLSPTTKAAPTTTPLVNGKNSSPSLKTTVACKGQITTTTKSSASFSRSHGTTASNSSKSSGGVKSNNTMNKNSPTISPPTPEVTITKLPNSTLATSTPTTTTRNISTSNSSSGNSKNSSGSNNSGGNSSGNNNNNGNNNSRPVPGLVKLPAHTNTVSITKRPVSSNKYAVAKSPANASIRQIPNPSLLRHHLSEPRNNSVNTKSTVAHHASNTNGPNKMWSTLQQTRGGTMLKAAGNSPLKETGPLPETSSILQIEHLTQSFDTSVHKGVGNLKYFDAR